MGIDWSIYESMSQFDGNTERTRLLTREQRLLQKDMAKSPAMKTVYVQDKMLCMLMLSTDKPSEKKFLLLPGDSIDIGTIVVWNEMHWLVTQIDFDDELQRGGRIVQCNRIIKWQNVKTLEIISRWCLCTKPYTSNIEDGNVLSTSNREYKIQLPFDSETRLIDLDKRFLLEEIGGVPRAYKMTSVDTLTNRYEDIDGGFLIWNLTQDTYDVHKDNAELMIADYIDLGAPPAPPPGPDPTLLKCEILGRSDIKIGGSPRKYTARFYAADGVTEIADGSVTAQWDFVIDPANAGFFKCTPNGNSISISVAENGAVVGLTGVLRLTDTTGAYQSVELIVEAVVM